MFTLKTPEYTSIFLQNTHCPFQLVRCKFRHEHAIQVKEEVAARYEKTKGGSNEKSDDEAVLENTDVAIDVNSETNGDKWSNRKEPSEVIMENQCHLCMEEQVTHRDLMEHFRCKHIGFYNSIMTQL